MKTHTQININKVIKMIRAYELELLVLLLAAVMVACGGQQPFTAMYVFGDSMSDPGNNIYLQDSLAKANYLPYGIDFEKGATGRFSNGKIAVDLIAEMLGLPLLPSYANTVEKGDDILSGINYASAGAGILPDTGNDFVHVIPFSAQIDNFRDTISQLRNQMQDDELKDYLAKALVVVNIGVNDYINNYLLPPAYKTSHMYSPEEFADLLAKQYTDRVLSIRSLGPRKIFLVELAPAGCAPMRIAAMPHPPGECEPIASTMVQMFNDRLISVVDQLSSEYPDTLVSRGAAYQLFTDLRNNAEAYGFTVKDSACCGQTTSRGNKLLCFPNAETCTDRDQYLFWDFAHLTEAANRVLVRGIYNDTAYCSPLTIEQMGNM